MNKRQLQSDARWWKESALKAHLLPQQVACWLLDRGSLTQRIIRACSGRFRVQLLGQSWQRPLREESVMLGIDPQQWVLIRHVLLLCEESPWVYARTVIPRKTLTGRHRRLKGLGERPLGAVLFADRHMVRGEVEVAQLHPHQSLHSQIEQASPVVGESVWARRSLFQLSSKPLLVYECFLPQVGRCRE
ncbi:MAG: chorismate lyase [Gammaproteobacteria bacterium]|nr:chorismate lyase [Gammaproteobacteria bacterium]